MRNASCLPFGKLYLSEVVCVIALCAAAVIASPAQSFTTIHSFPPGGTQPSAGLILDRLGDLYGTAPFGGDHGKGTVFTILSNGTFMLLHSFNGSDGSGPGAILIGTDGYVYGTTYSGGTSSNCDGGCGTVYKLTDDSGITTLHSFNGGDGSNPYGALVQASDGNIYGTTLRGGANGGGTVFRITHSGTLTTIYSFTGVEGGGPNGVIQASDGKLYGTAGGPVGGIIFNIFFRMTLDGTFTLLHNFIGADGVGGGIRGGLLQGTDGDFYGTTDEGTPSDYGAIFKVTPSGVVTPLHVFDINRDGGQSQAGLIQGSDGNFYGTTWQGGRNGYGTVFKVTFGGTFTTLHAFGYGDGGSPVSGLVQGSNGTLYGTTSLGGPGGGGTAFSLTTPSFIPTTTSLTSAPNPSNVSQTVTMTATVHAQNGSRPVGRVFFQSDGVGIGSATLNNSGVAVLNYSLLPAGTRKLLAFYEGGNGYGGVASNTVNQVVNALGTTTTVTSAPNPSYYGQQVTITATVSPSAPPAPTGTVRFTSNGTVIEGCEAITLTSRQAVCDTTSLAAGTDAIVATYSGDHNYIGSSGMVSQSVDSHFFTFTAVSNNPNPSTLGQQVTITGAVFSPVGDQPTGTVAFTSNGTRISGCEQVPLISQGAVCTTSTLPVGTDRLVAAYSGDSTYAPSSGTAAQFVNPVPVPLNFVSTTPCRLVDTRQSQPIRGNTSQSFAVPQLGGCGIPGTAVAYSLNVTVVPHGPLGYLTIWPTGEGQPLVSTMNSSDGRVKANAAIVPAGDGGAVSVYVTDTSDVILDIGGYFTAPGPATYQFYPLTPCRVIDTRGPLGELGGPYLHGGRNDGTHRDFPVRLSQCIPSDRNVMAFSMNFTVAPHVHGQRLGYLTVWPEGSPQPLVSTLNNPTGTVVANAGIVPQGLNRGISVFAYDDTDLIVDINGYFGPPGQGGYSFYPVAPCRVYDSRNQGPLIGGFYLSVDFSPCSPPRESTAFVLNATVVPVNGPMGYLSLWPDGGQQPVVSTLNAYDGLITSNMAMVPNLNGDIDGYVDGLTHLILDISGYFAP